MAKLYFIETNLYRGSIKSGSVFVERSTMEMDLKSTVTDILEGQVTDINAVYCADLEAKTFTDATKEVAQAVLDRLDQEPSRDVLDFLEEGLGCATVARVCREMEFA